MVTAGSMDQRDAATVAWLEDAAAVDWWRQPDVRAGPATSVVERCVSDEAIAQQHHDARSLDLDFSLISQVDQVFKFRISKRVFLIYY